jgi:6,7-dimethyl-8-ribityllumazine synthase
MSETEHEAPGDDAVADEEPVAEEGEVAHADGDPFAAWPQPETGEVIEDLPEEGQNIEHVEGEIDVPDGYEVIEGTPSGKRRSVAVVVSRFNGGLTNRMLARALAALDDAGVAPDAVTIVPVPGAFELPLAAMALAKTRRYACVVALGAIVRGETPHFDYIASEAA